LISGVLHGAAIVAILVFTGMKTPAPPVREHITFLTPSDVLKYDFVKENVYAGGGGGDRSNTPASIGNLPRRATRQFVAPTTQVLNENPVLTMEPAIVANPEIAVPQLTLAQIGLPNGVVGPPSNGTGRNGGIGNGNRGGVGDGDGPGAGPGDRGGVASARSGLQGAITQPVLIYKAEPEYSEEARKAKVQGSVMIHAEIDARGQIQNISIARGLGLGLDERAAEAVRKWRFRPATQNGKPVAANALIEVSFRLL
jgi:TonB family protein